MLLKKSKWSKSIVVRKQFPRNCVPESIILFREEEPTYAVSLLFLQSVLFPVFTPPQLQIMIRRAFNYRATIELVDYPQTGGEHWNLDSHGILFLLHILGGRFQLFCIFEMRHNNGLTLLLDNLANLPLSICSPELNDSNPT